MCKILLFNPTFLSHWESGHALKTYKVSLSVSFFFFQDGYYFRPMIKKKNAELFLFKSFTFPGMQFLFSFQFFYYHIVLSAKNPLPLQLLLLLWPISVFLKF